MRQSPFAQWRRGEAACEPGLFVAGASTPDLALAARRGKVAEQLDATILRALDELVAG